MPADEEQLSEVDLGSLRPRRGPAPVAALDEVPLSSLRPAGAPGPPRVPGTVQVPNEQAQILTEEPPQRPGPPLLTNYRQVPGTQVYRPPAGNGPGVNLTPRPDRPVTNLPGVSELHDAIGVGPMDAPFAGADAIARGVDRMGRASSEQADLPRVPYGLGKIAPPFSTRTPEQTRTAARAESEMEGGAAEALGGAAEVGSYLLPYGAIKAPVATAVGLAGFEAGGRGAEALADKMGASPERKELAKQAGALLGGGVAGAVAGHAAGELFGPGRRFGEGLDPKSLSDADLVQRFSEAKASGNRQATEILGQEGYRRQAERKAPGPPEPEPQAQPEPPVGPAAVRRWPVTSEVPLRDLHERINKRGAAKGPPPVVAPEAEQPEQAGPPSVMDPGQAEEPPAPSAPDRPDIKFSAALPGFYSQLKRTIEQKMPARAPVEQIRAIIENPQNGVKADEIQSTGLGEWLTQHAKQPYLEKGEVLDFLKDHGVVVREDDRRVSRNDLRQLEDAQGQAEAAASEAFFEISSRLESAPLEGLRSRERNAYRSWNAPWVAMDAYGIDGEGIEEHYPYVEQGDEQYIPAIQAAVPREMVERYVSLARAAVEAASRRFAAHSQQGGGTAKYEKHTLPGGGNYRERLLRLPNASPEYEGPHWDEPNVVAHERSKTHAGPDGEKIYHIEELQSDWHQAGRKSGYRTPQEADRNATGLTDEEFLDKYFRPESYGGGGLRANGRPVVTHSYVARADTGEAEGLLDEGEPIIGNHDSPEAARADAIVWVHAHRFDRHKPGSVPAAPFSKTWHELAFKRALRAAVEGGYDKVTWTTGAQQAGRYADGLRQVVDSIEWEPWYGGSKRVVAKKDGRQAFLAHIDENGVITQGSAQGAIEKHIGDVLGKEIALRVMGEGQGEVRGGDLTLGGEGMKGFYDTMLPSFANKYVKKWGGKVGKTTLATGDVVHSLEITPAMREGVMQGQPLFSASGGVNAVDPNAKPKARTTTYQFDASKVKRLGGPQPNAPVGVREFFDEAKFAHGDANGVPVVYVNYPAMTAILDLAVTAGFTRPGFFPGGMALSGKDARIIEGAAGRFSSSHPVAEMVGDAIYAGMTVAHKRKEPCLIVVLATEDIADAALKRFVEEEYDHVQQEKLPGGIDNGGMPVQAMKTPEGLIAEAALRQTGYSVDANLTAEAMVRLMRPGRLAELDLTDEQARALTEAMVKGLAAHGEAARGIIDQLHEAADQNHPAGVAGDRGIQEGLAPTPGDVPERGPGSSEPGTGQALSGDEGSRSLKYSAIGDAGREFKRQNLVPALLYSKTASKNIIKGLVNTLAPRVGVSRSGLDAIYELRGDRSQAEYMLQAAADAFRKEITKLPVQPDPAKPGKSQIEFIDRLKTGQAQATRTLQNIADFLRQMDDALLPMINQWANVKRLDDHFRLMWKIKPGGGKASVTYPGAHAPLQGSRGYMKRMVYQTLSDGIAAGGVPVSYNAIDLFALHYSDVMKYVTARRLWDQYKSMGLVQFIPATKAGAKKRALLGPGFVKLHDQIAKVAYPAKDPKGAMVHAGEWVIEEGVGRLLNNYLSKDYLRDRDSGLGSLGRALLGVKMMSTAMELSLSGFHFTFETAEAAASSIGLGIRKIANLGLWGNPKATADGLKDIAKGLAVVPAARETWKTGKAAEELAKATAKTSLGVDPRALQDFLASDMGKWLIKKYPDAINYVSDYFHGGGTIGIHQDFKLKAIRAMQQHIQSDDPLGAALRAIPAVMEGMMVPLFEWYIPRLKLGLFLREMSQDVRERHDDLMARRTTLRELARQNVDFVEDRLGEMNFDNLFWDRTFKSAMQMLFRSVTWKLGTIRGGSTALYGQASQLAGVAKQLRLGSPQGGPPLTASQRGTQPRVTREFAWLAGIAVLTAVYGTVTQMMYTGKRPEEVKDLIYPQIDPHDPSQRVGITTYLKDYYHMKRDPLGYLKGGFAGEIERVLDVRDNKEFYGEKVYYEDDPAWRQTWDAMKHLFPMPFSVDSYQRMRADGQSLGKALLSGAGIIKAPRSVTDTPAEALAREFSWQHQPVGGRTREEQQKRVALGAVSRALREGRDAEPVIQNAINAGFLQRKDITPLVRTSKLTYLQREVQSREFSVNEIVRLWEAASPQERNGIEYFVRQRVLKAASRAAEWAPQTREKVAKYFQIYTPGSRPGPPPVR